MKKLVFGFVLAALFLGMSGTASAGHRHYSGCGHNNYGHQRSYRAPVYANYWHDHFYQGRNSRCHYYGGRHNYSYAPFYVAPAPVYVAPVYQNYWHDHNYRGRYDRCHYYSGRHHYGNYYRPQNRFHFGISIFR